MTADISLIVDVNILLHLKRRKWRCRSQNCARSGDRRVGNWHVNWQHSSYCLPSSVRLDVRWGWCDGAEFHQSSTRGQQVGTRQHGPASSWQSRARRLQNAGKLCAVRI